MMDFCFGKARLGLAASVVLASQIGLTQQPFSVKEKAAANAVTRLVEEARKEKGLPKLKRISDRHLQQDACARARKGNQSLGQSTGIGPPEKVGMISALWYSTLDPNQPPPELLKWAKSPEPQYSQPHRFAVGVCIVSTPGHPEERYWIDVGTYMSAIESLLNVPTWD
jgi:hypothetical protein